MPSSCIRSVTAGALGKPNDDVTLLARLSASDASHHPERSGSVRSYKPTGHRHVAEAIGATLVDPSAVITTHLAELVRHLAGRVKTDRGTAEPRLLHAGYLKHHPVGREVAEADLHVSYVSGSHL